MINKPKISDSFSVSFFTDQFDTSPIITPMTWEALCERLSVFTDSERKDAVGLWSPTLFSGKRSNANALGVSAAVFDIDSMTSEELDALWERLDAARVQYFAHSTYSYTPERPKFRLLLRLSRTVSSSAWRMTWAKLAARYGLKGDEKAKDPARVYYLPSCPPGGPLPVLIGPEGTEPIDVDGLFADLPVASSPAPEIDVATYREKLPGAFSDPIYRDLADRIYHGKPLADVGRRDSAVFAAVGVLLEKWPELTAEALLSLLIPSLGKMQAHDFDALAVARSKIARDKAKQPIREALKKAEAEELEAFEREFLGPVDESTKPYTDAELDAWAKELGVGSREALARQFLIQYGHAFYAFNSGRYTGPIGREAIMHSLNEDFARCRDLLWRTKPNGEGQRRAKLEEIMERNGRVAVRAISTYIRQVSKYDPVTRTFWHAVCPLRALVAKEHPEIQKWLELLGGEHRDKLLDWVATVTDLARSTCALYFESRSKTGKNLFVEGLARLWTEGSPTMLEDIHGAHQDALLGCPIVFANENLPDGATIFLRRMVGSTRSTVKQKFRDVISLEGAPRLVIAGNNPDLLRTASALSQQDIQATAERILHIKVPDETAAYLDSVPLAVKNSWIKEDKLAEHALWLRDTRKVTPAGRLLVEGGTSGVLRRLALGTVAASAVCEWVVAHIEKPEKDSDLEGRVLVGGGEVLVNPKPISKASLWATYCPARENKMLNRRDIGRGLAQISRERLFVRVKGVQTTLYRVNVRMLLDAAAEFGVSEETISEAINTPNPEVEVIREHNPEKFGPVV